MSIKFKSSINDLYYNDLYVYTYNDININDFVNIKRIYLYDCNNIILQNLLNVKELYLYNSHNITIEKINNLEIINLEYSDINIKDDELKKLKEIKLRECKDISIDKMKNLEKLELINCEDIFISELIKLKELSIKNCINIDVEYLYTFINLQKLIIINVKTSNLSISDYDICYDIKELPNTLTKLKILEYYGENNIVIPYNLSNLKKIKIYNNNNYLTFIKNIGYNIESLKELDNLEENEETNKQIKDFLEIFKPKSLK